MKPIIVSITISAAALVAAGCSFSPPGANDGERDAAPLPDGPLPDGTTRCGWSYIPVHFDPCAIPDPMGANATFPVSGTYAYDTGSNILTEPGGAQNLLPYPSDVIMSDQPSVRVISVESFALGANRTLRVVGPHPLLIASRGGIDIDGLLDAGSVAGAAAGAGANPAVCTVDPGGGARPGRGADGTDEKEGGGGGGGGGFGDEGARGGNSTSGGDGGPRGDAVEAPTFIRGGCGGGIGGTGDLQGEPDGAGGGGAGGGAVQLTANVLIAIDGAVNTGGAGGTAARGGMCNHGRRHAGGGGGSGGYIGLEAPQVRAGAMSVLAANGGGGGGGTNNDCPPLTSDGGNGEAIATADEQAPGGGTGEGAGALGGGGDGGFRMTPDGRQGQDADRGGGGGGGGVGHILVFTGGKQIDGNATVSPQEQDMDQRE